MPISDFNAPTEATSREYTLHEWEVDMFNRQAAHQQKLTELEIEKQKLDAKFNALLRLPFVIITLPVRILFLIPLCIYAVKHKEVPEELWNLLR